MIDEQTAEKIAKKIMDWLAENTWELEFNYELSAENDIKEIILNPDN